MYEEFLDDFCKDKGISKEDALKLAIVKEVLDEKRKYEEEEQVFIEKN